MGFDVESDATTCADFQLGFYKRRNQAYGVTADGIGALTSSLFLDSQKAYNITLKAQDEMNKQLFEFANQTGISITRLEDALKDQKKVNAQVNTLVAGQNQVNKGISNLTQST